MNIACLCRIDNGGFTLDLSLDVPERGFTAITGPSGSGKTTFLRFLAGLDTSPGCRLVVGNQLWQDGDYVLPTHKRGVGYVFQKACLFRHVDVRGNIDYAKKRAALSIIDHDDMLRLLDIDHLLDRPVHRLSGGEQQRVAIARALASCPQLLLFDEPLASLGDTHRADIMPYLESIHVQYNIPVIYVSHSIDEIIRLASYVLVFDNGRLHDQGELQDVLSRNTGDHAQAVSVISAQVVGYDSEYGLMHVRFSGGELLVSGHSIAHSGLKQVRLTVYARDVSLSREAHMNSSILNQIVARVEQIDCRGNSALIRLAAGDACLLSRITRKSVDQLGVRIGCQVFAQVQVSAVHGYAGTC